MRSAILTKFFTLLLLLTRIKGIIVYNNYISLIDPMSSIDVHDQHIACI